MPAADKRRLTLEEAAELIFNTAEPTPQQVGRVRNLIMKGVLAGNPQQRLATSTESVAQYLAMAAMVTNKAKEKSATTDDVDKSTAIKAARAGERDMRPLYSDLMKDYFLAVVRRRGTRRRSASFQRAVLAGQVVLLGLFLWLFIWIGFSGGGTPGEIEAVKKYLAKKMPKAEIESWGSPKSVGDGAVTLIRVTYSYPDNKGDRKTTNMVFTVRAGRVISSTSAGLEQATADPRKRAG